MISFPLNPKPLWRASLAEFSPELAWELATGGPWPDPELLSGPDRFMAMALREGTKGVGLSSPNPPVGCVLVRGDHVLGRGVHTRAGDPHAEIMALRDAERRNETTQGSAAYITLEPCCHHGRTPPCTEALIRAGIRSVYVGVRDPNPRVDGGGFAILRAQGIQVQEGILGIDCARFHAPFFKLIRTGLPWVTLKLALGSDNAMGPQGHNHQITPHDIQLTAHALRRASEAIVVGRRTIEVDDPLLTDRWPTPTLPHRLFRRIVLDCQGLLPPDRQVWKGVEGQPALRVTVGEYPTIKGVEQLRVPPGPGGCSLRHLLHELVALNVSRVLIEGGSRLALSALDQDLVDEFHLFKSDMPAGGTSLPVDLQSFSVPRLRFPFFGGSWAIHRHR